MTTPEEVSIFIAEDHVVSRMGLKMILEQTEHFKVVGEADDGEAAVKGIEELKPDIVMMDLNMPKLDGIEATRIIKDKLPDTRILIFTSAEDDESIFSALKAGADGYCLKNISAEGDLLKAAITSVLQGAAWLDPTIAKKVMLAREPKPAVEEKKPEEKKVEVDQVSNVSESKIMLLELIESGKSYKEISQQLDMSESLVKGQLRELMGQLQGAQQEDAKTAITSGSKGSLSVGDVIGGHYEITEILGFGGMGMVYKAKHQHIDRIVAIKTMHEHMASDALTLERFKQEAQATSSIVHPNLVTIFDFGIVDGKVPYIVMEYLDGISLDELIEDSGRLSTQDATHVFIQICKALHEVHNHGIVHRDLKPSNIMLIEREGDINYVKLVDFGIAKVMQKGFGDQALTSTGEIIGSPPYISPEYVQGQKIDIRSDLYSLGCLMFEAYTGQKAFIADSPMETLMKHVNSKAPMELLEGCPDFSRKILTLLLNKNPQERPGSAIEIAEYLSKAS